jgi:hypothetical protein
MLRFLLLFGIFLMPVPLVAFAQNASPTPTIAPAPPVVTTSPNPNLQYVPQKAYIVTTPDGQVQAVPVQEGSSGAGAGELTGIAGIIAAIGGTLYAKLQASKDNKQTVQEVKYTNAALLNTKEAQKETARVMYNFQPDQSKALSDAPAIKLETLERDKAEFAAKVAKS